MGFWSGTRLARWLRRFRPPRRLRFTREGRTVVLLAVGIGFAAINTGNNLLYLLLGWLLSFIIASGILSEMTLKKLGVERRPPPRVYANEPFLMEVVIENAKLMEEVARMVARSKEGVKANVENEPFITAPPPRTSNTSGR